MTLVILFLLASSLSVSAAGGEWSFKRSITIDHTKVTGTLSDFPVLVDVTLGSGRAQSDARDIYFTSSDGITKLNHEIESYDTSAGRVVAWVNVPNLNNISDVLIYIFYGNPGADDQQNPTAVWDINYLSVHHLEEKDGVSIKDSTGKNNGVANNVTLDVIGKIDGADQFSISNSRITLSQIFTNQNQFSIEGWIYVTNKTKIGAMASQRDWSSKGTIIQYDPAGIVRFYVNDKNIQRPTNSSTWYYVVGTYDGTTARLYVSNQNSVSTLANLTWPIQLTDIGNREDTKDRSFAGVIDEVRISNIARSDAYIKTSYTNQNNPTTFILLGEEETLASQPIVSNENPTDGKSDVYINLTELDFDLLDPQGKLMDYKVTTSPNIGSRSENGVSDGTYKVSVSNLQHDVTYTWNVNVTNGVEQTYKTFSFTTAPSQNITVSNWSFRRTITLDHTKVVGSLSNYPVLIDATIGSGRAQSDAHDIYFTSSDGSTKLNHEIESFDPATGRVVAWVNIPNLNNVTDIILYMYYGNPSATNQQNPTGVWDNNYLSVHHLEEKSGTNIADSTTENNGIANSVTLGVTGKIDGANQFDGTNSRITLPQVFNSQNQFTVEGWAYIDISNAKQGAMVSQRDWSSHGMIVQYDPAIKGFRLYVNDKNIQRPANTTGWYYLAGTYDGTTVKLYINNINPSSTTASLAWPSIATDIGNREDTKDRPFAGKIDEIRISNTARSEAYIKTNYNNQNNPTAFITLGNEETLSAKPIVSNEKPADGKTDIYTNLSELSFDLFHPQGKLMDYTVRTNPNIGSRSGNGVDNGTYPVFVSNLQPGITYTWYLNVTDGTELVQKTLTFTTIALPSQVTISDAYPNGGNATYNPRLSIKIDNPQNNDLTILFETNVTGSWETIGTQNGKSGVYYQRTDKFDVKNKIYYWRVSVFDGSTWTIGPTYAFTAQPFILKWTAELDGNNTLESGALAVDANNDGIYEVFVSGNATVTAFNGTNGQRLWIYKNPRITYHAPMDIGDLNNDGIPEILLGAGTHTITLHANNGTVYWDVPIGSGDNDKHNLIVDTDANHYPYVYATDSDITRGADGTGRIRKFNGTTGQVLAEVFAWRACSGGLSAADANNDGKLEIYMCDRRGGYEAGGQGKGMQAYDADTLQLLWYQPDITCSSHMQQIIDVNGDGIMDAVALYQSGTNGGVCVVDGATGQKMPGKCQNGLGLMNDQNGPIYDIDGDGNLEIVTARYSNTSIWDVGAWKPENVNLSYTVDPPRIGNVIGDNMQIILGYRDIIIYNSSYQEIERIKGDGSWPVPYSSYSVVQDIDNDGQNELIGINYQGKIYVWDTGAYAPTPRVRTNNIDYSERRLGVAEYVRPPGAPQPIIKETTPEDDARYVDLNPTLSVRVVDYQYDLMDVEISTNASGSWETVATFHDAENGWFSYTPTNMNQGDTIYYWRVTATDPAGDNLLTTKTFSFITKPLVWIMPGWDYRKQIKIDHTKVNGTLTNFPVLIDLTDSDLALHAKSNGDDILFTTGDGITKLAHEIESYDSGSGRVVAWVNVPSVSNTTDTSIYMYYGNLNVNNQQNPSGVWDSNYLNVEHLEEKDGTNIIDSTGKNNGVADNVSLNAAGKINSAVEFNGINSRITLPQIFTNQNQFTVEGWIYVTDTTKIRSIISQRNSSAQQGVIFQYDTTSQVRMYINDKNVPKPAFSYAWQYVVGTYDGTTGRLYINNKNVVTTKANLTWPNSSTYIGYRNDINDRVFAGRMDEVRISNIARSQAYIMTSYNNQNDPASFIIIGSVETADTKPAVINENPAHKTTLDTFNITELSFNLWDNSNDLMNYSVTTFPNIGSAVVNQVGNGRYSVPVSGLTFNTNYTWFVDVTDGKVSNHRYYTFIIPAPYILNLSISGNGTVTKSKESPYLAGSVVQLTANPAPGWTFIGWAGDRLSVSGTENPKNITMDADKSTSAIFRQIGVPLLNDSTFDVSVDSADLRANGLGQDWWESRSGASGGNSSLLTLDQTNVGGNTGKKAKLLESTTGNAYLTQEFSSPQPAKFSVEWDIYIDTILPYNGQDRAAQQMIGVDTGSSRGPNTGSKFVMMAFYHAGGSTAPNATMSLIAQELASSSSDSSTWRVIASDLFMDRWYKIRVNLNVLAGTYDVYVNDVLRAQGVQANAFIRPVTHISFASWNDGEGTFYVDNVREYSTP
jgi:hypothetical protein